MAEEQLNRAHVGPGLEKMDGKGVSQGVRRDPLGEPRSAMGALTRLADGVARDRLIAVLAGKQPHGRPVGAPPVAQACKERRGEHDVAIALAFPLLDGDHHPAAVDIRGSEVDGFRNARARGVARRQDGAVLGVRDACQEVDDFVGAEHDRQASRLFRCGNQIVERPRCLSVTL